MPTPAPEELHTKYEDFVGSSVITIPITAKIIREIMPFFPKSSKVISGYLNEEQLYWKLNFHWEFLLWAIDICRGLTTEKATIDALDAMTKKLNTNKPDPVRGYRISTMPGEPADKSSHETILARYRIMMPVKKSFAALVAKAGLMKLWKLDPKSLSLSYANVLPPKEGNHKSGFAIDIKGNNAEIRRISLKLGATMAYDEDSHVHTEWANGVDTTAMGAVDSKAESARATRQLLESGLTNFSHFLCVPR